MTIQWNIGLSTASDWVSVAAETTEITGLDDGTYYVRYEAATSGSTAFASAYIAVAVGTTGATPETQPTAAADYPNEKLTGLTASSVYDIGGTEYTADVSGEIAIQDGWFGTTINIVKKGNGTTTTNSTAQNLELAARPAAPDASAFTVTQPTASVSTGTITGITSSMGYSTDSGMSWTAGNGSAVAGLAPGNVLVRVTATASAPKSGSLTITITAYQTPGGGTSGGGTNTNEDEAESIEIISEDGSTLATGTITEIENGVGISISSNQVDLLAGSGQSVMFETDTVSVSFDTAAVDYIDVAAGSDDMELTIVRVEPSNLSEENRQLIGDRPVYEFSLTAVKPRYRTSAVARRP